MNSFLMIYFYELVVILEDLKAAHQWNMSNKRIILANRSSMFTNRPKIKLPTAWRSRVIIDKRNKSFVNY
ncbi:hypothetical protein BpHYR1_052131 [Brachionus plicatilis]|uniref:Uncharacterized protein n=1 Tax=Brachionus plicatilis TaxID=10195 RepID=A0A3M7RX49_BRAPC|nr:hypothetical protein BpHYR1_052131 [Brachionus plicatilis]